MKEYLLPEREYECYFIPAKNYKPRGPKRLRSWLDTELESLHPGFGPLHAVDGKMLKIAGLRWYLATVMAPDNLAEHRLIAGSAPLVGLRKYGVSPDGVPCALSEGGGSPGIELNGRKKIVFARPYPSVLRPAVILVLAALSLALPAAYRHAGKQPPAPVELSPGDVPDIPRPTALHVLSGMAKAFAERGAVMKSLEISVGVDGYAAVSARGIEPSDLMPSLEAGGFLAGGTVGEISFEREKPAYSLRYSIPERPGVREPNPVGLDSLASAMPVLRSAASDSAGTLESLKLTETRAGTELDCLASVSLPRSALFFRALETGLDAIGMAVTAVRIEGAAPEVLRVGVFMGRSRGDAALRIQGDGFASVPAAFGYRLPVQRTTAQPPPAAAAVGRGTRPEAGWERIGSIGTGTKDSIVYWRDAEGKIYEIAD